MRRLALGGGGLLLAALTVAGARSYRDLATVRRQETALEAKVEQTQQRIDSLRQRLERLRGDPATLERLAREELGMVRPGDVVIVLPEEKGAKDGGGVSVPAAGEPPGASSGGGERPAQRPAASAGSGTPP